MIKFSTAITDVQNFSGSHDLASGGTKTIACSNFLKQETSYQEVSLLPSGTSAIEVMAQFLSMRGISKILAPSFTFSTTILPFIERGIEVKLCDVELTSGTISRRILEQAVDDDTGAVIAVSYAGGLPDQQNIIDFCHSNNIIYMEDSAQSLGSIGVNNKLKPHAMLCALSFHYTKNISCGEGGAVLYSSDLVDEILPIINKGTNRHLFDKGAVKKYHVTSYGSSHIMSEWNALLLHSQLLNLDEINSKRMSQWETYAASLSSDYDFLYRDEFVKSGVCPTNGHIFGLLCKDKNERYNIAERLIVNGVESATHYPPLHENNFIGQHTKSADCTNTVQVSERLLRLPIGTHLSDRDILKVIEILNKR